MGVIPVEAHKARSHSAFWCVGPRSTGPSDCPPPGSGGCDAQQLNRKQIRKNNISPVSYGFLN